MSADYFALATEQVREAGRRLGPKKGTLAGVLGRMGPGQSLARICSWCGSGLTPTAKSFAARGVPETSGMCESCKDREMRAVEWMEVSP